MRLLPDLPSTTSIYNWKKCEFEQSSIEYIGLVISEGEVQMDPVKVEAVKDWPTPTSLCNLWGFLGFANFYQRLIEGFAKKARPLNNLTWKDIKWNWSTDQQEAFQSLKDSFTSSTILVLWDLEKSTRIEVDASGFATGGTLSQLQEDGLWHPIAFCSASMIPTEYNYEIYNCKMLAIIEALKDWRSFLEGLLESFEIITDHQNLKLWRTAQISVGDRHDGLYGSPSFISILNTIPEKPIPKLMHLHACLTTR